MIIIDNFNTSKVKNMGSMFSRCSSLIYVNVSSFNTSNVENMSFMFKNCTSLNNLNLTNFDFTKAYKRYCMFSNCQKSLATLVMAQNNMIEEYQFH